MHAQAAHFNHRHSMRLNPAGAHVSKDVFGRAISGRPGGLHEIQVTGTGNGLQTALYLQLTEDAVDMALNRTQRHD